MLTCRGIRDYCNRAQEKSNVDEQHIVYNTYKRGYRWQINGKG